MGSARAKRFGANSGSHCGSISGGAKRLEPRFWGMGFFEGFGGGFDGVLDDFWGIFWGSHCFREMFVVRLESLFWEKKLAFLNCAIQNLIAVEMSPRFIFHISRHKGPNFQRFLLSLEQWSILAGIPCWLRPLSKGSIKRNGRAPRSYTPENERMTMENQPFKRCIPF